MFGDDFPSDAMHDDYARYESSIGPFMRGYPRLLDRKGYEARDRVLKHLVDYVGDESKFSGGSQLILAHLKVGIK